MSFDRPETEELSRASLALGVAAFLHFLFQPLALLAIPAIVCGHLALVRISRSDGQLRGRREAIVGLGLGYLLLIGTAVLLTLVATGALGSH